MEGQEMVYFSKEHSERAKAVLLALDGMNVSEAQEMLSWCSRIASEQTNINWRSEAERREPTCSDNESCLDGEEAAPEAKAPERPEDVQSGFIVPAPTEIREGADAFLEGCRANREWLLDILGDEAVLNEMVDEIAAVMYKRCLRCGTKASYKAVMYALQRAYMNEFMDFLC